MSSCLSMLRITGVVVKKMGVTSCTSLPSLEYGILGAELTGDGRMDMVRRGTQLDEFVVAVQLPSGQFAAPVSPDNGPRAWHRSEQRGLRNAQPAIPVRARSDSYV